MMDEVLIDPQELEPRIAQLEGDMQFFRNAIQNLMSGQKALFDIAVGLCRTKADLEVLVAWAAQYAMYKAPGVVQ